MSFKLDEQEDVSEGIRRIIVERIDDALGSLRSKADASLGETVHTARKRFKEARAALRLVRNELGEERFAEGNRALRDAGRPLSEVRDAHVLVEALDKLAKRGAGLTPAAARPLREMLLERRRDVGRRVITEGGALEAVASSIETTRQKFKDWPMRRGGWKAIGPGLERVYRDGRDAMRRAAADGSDEDFHEWRKRVKDLRYELEILQPLWPDVIEEFAGEAHALADDLGDDHDLSVLREIALDMPRKTKRSEALSECVGKQQEKLRRRAKALGRRLYAEKPGAFAARVHAYLDAFRDG